MQKHIFLVIDQIDDIRGSESYCIAIGKFFKTQNWKVNLIVREKPKSEIDIFDSIIYKHHKKKINEYKKMYAGDEFFLINISSWYLLYSFRTELVGWKVIIQHHSDFNYSIKHLRTSLKHNWNHLNYCKGAKLGVISKSLFDKLSKKQQRRAVINYNIFDIKHEKCTKKNEIIYVGNLKSHSKDPELVLEILESCAKNNPNIKFKIYGDYNEEDIFRFVNYNNVYFKGVESDIDKIYKSAKCIFLVSIFEGFPRVLIEAQAYEVPSVVLNRFTSAKEIVKSGVTGELVETTNKKLIEDKIIYVYENYEKYKNGCINSSHQYSSDIVGKEMIKIFEGMGTVEKRKFSDKVLGRIAATFNIRW